ncbi:MAG: metal ABC transporter permease, partial [Defluviitaleaceae bacterium]|nr:metal ABC transporter permease [Defluviitaleaceae bacterium]
MEIFEFAFMQRAFAVGILLALIIPCIGIAVVFRRLSMMGDALAHVSLAGVAAGLVLGVNPILGAVATTIAAAFGIEAIRKRIPHFSELSIAVMFSLGVGLTGVLSSFVRSSANLHSFLFGSIVAITNFELWLVAGLSVTVLLTFLFLYQEIFLIVLDE